MVTTLVPTSSGIGALHFVVPLASPESPVELAHLTETTATLSLAVPLTTTLAAAVERIVEPGDTIPSEGGLVSAAGAGLGLGFGFGGGGSGGNGGRGGGGGCGIGPGDSGLPYRS